MQKGLQIVLIALAIVVVLFGVYYLLVESRVHRAERDGEDNRYLRCGDLVDIRSYSRDVSNVFGDTDKTPVYILRFEDENDDGDLLVYQYYARIEGDPDSLSTESFQGVCLEYRYDVDFFGSVKETSFGPAIRGSLIPATENICQDTRYLIHLSGTTKTDRVKAGVNFTGFALIGKQFEIDMDKETISLTVESLDKIIEDATYDDLLFFVPQRVTIDLRRLSHIGVRERCPETGDHYFTAYERIWGPHESAIDIIEPRHKVQAPGE